MTEELYKKHRPKSFKSVIGQPHAVQVLNKFLSNGSTPHTILFTGPSGVGKTTLARILRTELECSEADFHEINSADFRGIDMVRSIRSKMTLAPINGKCRIWLIDELHQLSSQAQEAFLKILEDTPSHIYFLLATTDPQKLKKALVNRCTVINLKSVQPPDLCKLLQSVCKREKVELTEEVQDRLLELAEGSPRKSLVLLHSVIGLEDPEEQIKVLEEKDTERQAIEIARLLMNPKTTWPKLAGVLKAVDDDPEQLRWMILGYANSVLLSGGKTAPRAHMLIDSFRDNFYDSKKAGLAAACYEVVTGN